jgi:hypothetical protein
MLKVFDSALARAVKLLGSEKVFCLGPTRVLSSTVM